MWIRILIVALGVAWAATVIGIIWMLAIAGLPPRHLLAWLSMMELGLLVCATLSIGAAAFGLLSLRAGARRRAWTGVAGAFGFGVLGAVYGATGAQIGLVCMNPPIPFSIYAIGYAEALVVLLVSLTGTLLGLVLLSRSSPSSRVADRG